MRTPFAIANTALGALFVVGAILQWNDPDPLGWMLMYLAAAAASLAHGRVAWARPLAVASAGVAIAWGAWGISQMPTWVPLSQMFEPMESMGGAVEMAREVWGLAIIAVWMLVLVWTGRNHVSVDGRDV
tara:strand:+ start:80535 stop:80921 length:387 start_codon:yes stop_codon:yes gene_type:complete